MNSEICSTCGRRGCGGADAYKGICPEAPKGKVPSDRLLAEFIRANALGRAYEVAKDSCDACGMPATRCASWGPSLAVRCDACPFGEHFTEPKDHWQAKGVRALMKVARGE